VEVSGQPQTPTVFTWGIEPSCLPNGWLGGLHKLFRSLREKILFPLPEIEEQLLEYSAFSLVSIRNVLS